MITLTETEYEEIRKIIGDLVAVIELRYDEEFMQHNQLHTAPPALIAARKFLEKMK